MKNYQVKLHINKNIPPVAQRERRIPFALRERVKEELKKLEKQCIVEDVYMLTNSMVESLGNSSQRKKFNSRLFRYEKCEHSNRENSLPNSHG